MKLCTYRYAQALIDPFSLPYGADVCYPGTLPTPSQKLRTRTFGYFTVGTGGVGGVGVWPMRCLSTNVASDGTYVYPGIITTTGTYAPADFSFLDNPYVDPARTDIEKFGGYDSTYGTGSFGQRAVRVVASGVKVAYTSKLVDTEGSYTSYVSQYPTTGLPATKDTVQDLMAINATATRTIDDQPVHVCYKPIVETDTFFQLDPYQLFGSGNDLGAIGKLNTISNRLGMAIVVNKGNVGATFSFEVITYFEVVGMATPTTSSHSDITGVADVHTAIASLPAILSPRIDDVVRSLPQPVAMRPAPRRAPAVASGEPSLARAVGMELGKAVAQAGKKKAKQAVLNKISKVAVELLTHKPAAGNSFALVPRAR
jgi:hypothetical protein